MSYKTKSTSSKIENTSLSNKTTSQILNMQVKRKNSEFKNIEFNDFTVSNEIILATKQEFFFLKVAPVQSITDIVLLGFSFIFFAGMFPSCYTCLRMFTDT